MSNETEVMCKEWTYRRLTMADFTFNHDPEKGPSVAFSATLVGVMTQ